MSSPPKYPSCRNIGLCVREIKQGVYGYRDGQASAAEFNAEDIDICGISCGVSVHKMPGRLQTRLC
jgi:hypothetical protein